MKKVKDMLKKMAEGSTEGAFTIMKVYQPKMPKALRDKIEEKRD